MDVAFILELISPVRKILASRRRRSTRAFGRKSVLHEGVHGDQWPVSAGTRLYSVMSLKATVSLQASVPLQLYCGRDVVWPKEWNRDVMFGVMCDCWERT
jgi:hypothetical protein